MVGPYLLHSSTPSAFNDRAFAVSSGEPLPAKNEPVLGVPKVTTVPTLPTSSSVSGFVILLHEEDSAQRIARPPIECATNSTLPVPPWSLDCFDKSRILPAKSGPIT